MSPSYLGQQSNRRIATSDFYCYLLRSLDANHPKKTYIGFTTDPYGQLQQHNRVLKSGDASPNKPPDEAPWAYACVVHGFASQTSALQFEWVWQHFDKSIATRNTLGHQQVRKLKSKQEVYAKLNILKTLVTECIDVCALQQSLSIYFFDNNTKQSFEKIKLESNLNLPVSVKCVLIQSIEDIEFWRKRDLPQKKSSDHELYQGECMLCSKKLMLCDNITKCHKCCRPMHTRCNDIHAADGDGLCPNCDTFLDCDISFDSMPLPTDTSLKSGLLKPVKAVHINDDNSSLDSFEDVIARDWEISTFLASSLHQENDMDDTSVDISIESLLHFRVIEYSNTPVMSFGDYSV